MAASSEMFDARDPHIIAGWVIAVAQALDASGMDSQGIFSKAGIQLNDARKPTARFPATRMSEVYHLVEEATGDYTFGLSIADYIHPTSLHALGFSLFASSSLESFCRRIVR